MNKKPEFKDLFFSRTKDFLDLYLVRQEQRSADTVKAYRISLSSFYTYVTEEKQIYGCSFETSVGFFNLSGSNSPQLCCVTN
ncbi:MAG: hypothetical protein LIP11_09395 [Clostridiales bacterium]|nr:hypothetical protein [Clostridiales bacterium]